MNTTEQLRFYEELYDRKYDEQRSSRKEAWNHRASDWDQKYRTETEKDQHSVRVKDTAEWLRKQGLLGSDQVVADIGCGPGRFVAEFAKTARHVMGTDISPNMTEYGAAYCKEQELNNVEFHAVDFRNIDIAELGWERQFDLVFSSITPAVSGLKGLNNLLRMSRGWCFNASFVYSDNELQRGIMEEVFGRSPRRDKTSHSHWFHELFNLLWFRGYYPQSTYYKQHKELQIRADYATAMRLADFLLEDGEVTEKNAARILDYLERHADADGMVKEQSDCWYGWLLWDVRDCHERV